MGRRRAPLLQRGVDDATRRAWAVEQAQEIMETLAQHLTHSRTTPINFHYLRGHYRRDKSHHDRGGGCAARTVRTPNSPPKIRCSAPRSGQGGKLPICPP